MKTTMLQWSSFKGLGLFRISFDTLNKTDCSWACATGIEATAEAQEKLEILIDENFACSEISSLCSLKVSSLVCDQWKQKCSYLLHLFSFAPIKGIQIS